MRTTTTTALVVLLLAVAGCTADEGSAGQGAAGAPGPTGGSAAGGATVDGDAGPSPVPTVTGGSGGRTGGEGSEVVPEASPAPSSLADLLPDDPPAAERLASPPQDATASTGLAKDFPTTVLLVPDGATVRSSSVTSDGGRTQLAIDAAVPGACGDLLVELRGWFGGGGFTETATAETAERADLTFSRDDGHVTVAAVAGQDACDLVQLGVLAAAMGDGS